jgi:DNA-binding SARP family transcriptional activator
MRQLHLYLLGAPRIKGVPIQVDTRKAIALLAYLAVHRERHQRDALATLLWPEHDRTHGRTALRRTLYALRKALGGDWLVADFAQLADLTRSIVQQHTSVAYCSTDLSSNGNALSVSAMSIGSPCA